MAKFFALISLIFTKTIRGKYSHGEAVLRNAINLEKAAGISNKWGGAKI